LAVVHEEARFGPGDVDGIVADWIISNGAKLGGQSSLLVIIFDPHAPAAVDGAGVRFFDTRRWREVGALSRTFYAGLKGNVNKKYRQKKNEGGAD
jgi:hypothetical protein